MKGTQTPRMVSPIFIGRWTPNVLFSLKNRPYRYGQLRRHLGRVSQRMLTRTLRNLESIGLIARRVTKSKVIAVEYSLTQLGRTIIAPLKGMCRWANLILQRGADTWTPHSVIRMTVTGHRIQHIRDYVHCPWIISAAGSVTSSQSLSILLECTRCA